MFILGMLVGTFLVLIVEVILVCKKLGINMKTIKLMINAKRNKSVDLEDIFKDTEFNFKKSDFED